MRLLLEKYRFKAHDFIFFFKKFLRVESAEIERFSNISVTFESLKTVKIGMIFVVFKGKKVYSP